MSNTIIKNIRKQKGMTLDVLAKITGLTKGYLSKVERANSLPPFSTLELIANALEVEITSLIEKESGEAAIHPDIDIMNINDIKECKIRESRDGCSFSSLLHSYRGRYMAPILVNFKPGAEQEFEHDAEEFVYVISGDFTLSYVNQVYDLKIGECFYLDSRKKHCLKNVGVTEGVLLSVTYNYRRF